MDSVSYLEVTFYGDRFTHADQDFWYSVPFTPSLDEDGKFEGYWDDNAGEHYTHTIQIPNSNLNNALRLTDTEIETGRLNTTHYNALRKAILAIIESEIINIGDITPVCYDDQSVGGSVVGMLGPYYPDAFDHYTMFTMAIRTVSITTIMPEGGGE